MNDINNISTNENEIITSQKPDLPRDCYDVVFTMGESGPRYIIKKEKLNGKIFS